jgi:hypothetical protein
VTRWGRRYGAHTRRGLTGWFAPRRAMGGGTASLPIPEPSTDGRHLLRSQPLPWPSGPREFATRSNGEPSSTSTGASYARATAPPIFPGTDCTTRRTTATTSSSDWTRSSRSGTDETLDFVRRSKSYGPSRTPTEHGTSSRSARICFPTTGTIRRPRCSPSFSSIRGCRAGG